MKCETNKWIVIYKQTWVAESCERKISCGDYTVTSFILRAYRTGETKYFFQCLCFINFSTSGQASAVTVLSSELSIIKSLYSWGNWMIWPDFCCNIILFVCYGLSFRAKEHFHSCFMSKIEEFDSILILSNSFPCFKWTRVPLL